MKDPITTDLVDELAPVAAEEDRQIIRGWTDRLVLFLRIMAGVSTLKGLYHWAMVCGFIGGSEGGFLAHTLAWQTATVFFAVIDLVAAVGLWLAAPWGAVVWLTGSVSIIVINVFFQQIYGDQIVLVVVEAILIAVYLFLAIQSAREHPQ